MSAALPNPADCCSTCQPSACGPPIDFSLLIQQIVTSQLGLFNVKSYGATGDGITNDTAAIQAAISAAADGGIIFFPDGDYRVHYTGAAAGSIFSYRTNFIFIGSGKARIMPDNYSTNLEAVFGADFTALPINNVQFHNLRFELHDPTALGAGGNSINVFTALDDPAESITQVRIQNCDFVNSSSAIYIKQRSTVGSETRQVSDVFVDHCTALGCFGSFVTAEGRGMTITNNIARGWPANPLLTFDAVSVHSGIGVLISNNQFSDYAGTSGLAVNIRNNVDSLCGSRDIIVSNNTFKDCPSKGVGIYLQDGEFTYGVKNVQVCDNNFVGSDTVIILNTAASTMPGVPFDNIKITGNEAVVSITGINCIGTGLNHITNLSICDNQLLMKALSADPGGRVMALNYCDNVQISGNKIVAYNNATNEAVDAKNISVLSFTDNQVISTDSAFASVVFDTLNDYTIVGNNLYANVSFSSVDLHGTVDSNNTAAAGTFNGHQIGAYAWGFNNGVFWNTSGAQPAGETWRVGDYVLNNLGTTQANYGWICLGAGTPGTWKTFGAIV